ncbi:MAG TPA: DUF4416 family protein [Bacteroidetes bacterium]|nr:DUF4416 family protein [Bacteroidota bacterium]
MHWPRGPVVVLGQPLLRGRLAGRQRKGSGMSQLRPVVKVMPILAVTYSDPETAEQALADFSKVAGPVAERSPAYSFSAYTDYYRREMGPQLWKFFAAFERLIEPDELVDLKHAAMRVEDSYRCDGRRRVNLDPGYLEFSKLVLSTTKNFDHRVYLGRGIYGDVQLRFRRGEFRFNDWTYPDYKSDLALDFFHRARDIYVDLEKMSRRVVDEPHGVDA